MAGEARGGRGRRAGSRTPADSDASHDKQRKERELKQLQGEIAALLHQQGDNARARTQAESDLKEAEDSHDRAKSDVADVKGSRRVPARGLGSPQVAAAAVNVIDKELHSIRSQKEDRLKCAGRRWLTCTAHLTPRAWPQVL